MVANVHLDQSEELGIVPSHSTLIHGALIKLGVPETAIEGFGNEVTNTYQEAMALREWMMRNRVHSVIVPTEVFSSRRVRWILEHELAGTGVKVQVAAARSDQLLQRSVVAQRSGAAELPERSDQVRVLPF
jgi:hypothetical protein